MVSEFGSADANFPEQHADISYGPDPHNGQQVSYFLQPTPGAANSPGVAGIVTDEVAFSEPGQSFDGQIDLKLSTTLATGTIRFTLDGRVPDESSESYDAWVADSPTNAITINSTTPVRARVFVPNMAPWARAQRKLHSTDRGPHGFYFTVADPGHRKLWSGQYPQQTCAQSPGG